jgi:hypothetical protein
MPKPDLDNLLGLLDPRVREKDVSEDTRTDEMSTYTDISAVPDEIREKVTEQAVEAMVDALHWLFLDCGPLAVGRAIVTAGEVIIRNDPTDRDLFLFGVASACRQFQKDTPKKGRAS